MDGVFPAFSLITATKRAEAPTVRQIDQAAAATDTNPSKLQQQAGNYRKGHITMHGLEISIENPKGSIRSGVSKDGTRWETEIKHHYGYFTGTSGADGDHLDVIVGPVPESELVHVVNQVKPGGSFDEHKCIVGAVSADQAKEVYLANYHKGWQGLGSIAQMTIGQFKKRLADFANHEPVKSASLIRATNFHSCSLCKGA